MDEPVTLSRHRPIFVRFLLHTIPHFVLVALFFGYICIGAVIFMELEGEHADVPKMAKDKKEIEDMMDEMQNCICNLSTTTENPGESNDNTSRTTVNPVQSNLNTGHDGANPGNSNSSPGHGKGSGYGKGQNQNACTPTEEIFEHMMRWGLQKDYKLARMQSIQANRAWSFTSALLFCATTITTIGYGEIVPVTIAGQMAVIVYSLIGIPLTLLLLADTGNLLGKVILFICKYFRPSMVLIRIKKDPLCSCFKVSSRHDPDGILSASQHANRGGSNSMGSTGLAQSQMSLNAIKIQTYDQDSGIMKQSDRIPVISDSSSRAYNQSLSTGIREDLYSPSAGKGSQDLSHTGSNTSEQNEKNLNIFIPSHNEVCEEVMHMSNDVVMEEVPITIVVLVFIGYTCTSAASIAHFEGWTFEKSLYFTFITLTTIGYGDVLPTTHYESGEFFSCIMYTIFGLAVTSMCIALVQAKVIRFCTKMATKLGF
ncbi:potassium channel subfamily K member 18-like [Amphiura filiformis]|uniref:potassium channel subfamily K member 18-like n=1 Tax=Amphiura filiformis TaxID=82378 RepID=UPI003B225EED